MLPLPQRQLQAPDAARIVGDLTVRCVSTRTICAAFAGLALGWAAPGWADDAAAPAATPAAPTTASATPKKERDVAFEANEVSYDSDKDLVIAGGNVVLRSEGQSIRADTVTWDRKANQIFASGNIVLLDRDGNELYADKLTLTDDLRAGAMENMLLAFREGGRLAAMKGERAADSNIVLTNAAYSACAVEDGNGCPKKPSWRVTAKRVYYDDRQKSVRFKGASVEVFGLKLLPLPGLVVTTDGRAISGITIPNVRISASNGFEFSEGYYARISDSQDLLVTGYGFTGAPPMISAQYRNLTDIGAFQITGYLTRSARIPLGTPIPVGAQNDWRGYIYANGKFQLSPEWSITASIRAASDSTFLARYDISFDDRLRSVVNAERIDQNSYLSIAAWMTQTLQSGDPQGQVPIALPAIDYRRRLDKPILGGQVEFEVNTLAITRTEGQDTQRAFAQAEWDMRRITSMGQVVTFTALARGDIYHSSGNDLTSTVIYQGLPGWQTRGVLTGAVDVQWPFVGKLFGGTQVLTPHVQVVATPKTNNFAIPNEDSRAIDLQDINLFALNRFPGYDRVEDGMRITYGFDWQLNRPNFSIKTSFGQSYRITTDPNLFPDGTGLNDRFSDFVGRTEIRYKNFLKVIHQFQLDKSNFAVRRNELDATIGSEKTYLEVGYLRLNRNIPTTIEDLQNRQELRVAGRVAFAKYWSMFGAAVINMTDPSVDPTSNGFQPLRTRLGFAYTDDCLELGVTWRRDYVTTGDAKKGNTFQLHVAFKHLGF